VVRYEPSLLPELTRFYRDIWDPAATEASVAASRAAEARTNPVAAGEEVPTFLFLKDGEAIGHLSTLPVLWAWDGAVRPAWWLTGFMVRPEHRNGPVGFLVLKEAIRHLDLALSLTVSAASSRLFRSLGFADLGPVTNHIRVLRPRAILRRLDFASLGLEKIPAPLRRMTATVRFEPLASIVAAALNAGLHGWSGVRSFGSGVPGVEPESPLRQDALEAMWQACRTGLVHGAVRDGAYLVRRYPIAPGGYRQVVALEKGAPVGGAWIRAPRNDGDPRLRGIRIATLSDFLYPASAPDVGIRVLTGAERAARRTGADALLASTNHRPTVELLRRRGFVPFPANLIFLMRDARNELPGSVTPADLWLSRGDMNADSVF
jgi:GNAT superfamily N-acetyltransferase